MSKALGYQPALDGVRALSIALVLAFHLGAPWMGGGYLGVSVFFTLSGFLITSLLLAERATSGRIDVRAFYVRRMRRLLPASLLCLAGIAVLASAGTIAARADLRGGVLGAVFQVANWEALLGERSYADLFLAPSPIDHFWSLAIEEQFYWVWPLAIAGLTALAARRTAGPRVVTGVLIGGFLALSGAAFATARLLGGDAAYFASWARFAEILAGAALAAVLARRTVPRQAAALAPLCLAAIVALAIVSPAGRGWAYEGGLPLFALLSAGLIAGIQIDGRVTRLLAREPLPAIGRVSYGLYLFHWPVITIMDGSGWVVQLAVTAGITAASYHLVERPVRLRMVLAVPRAYVLSAVAVMTAVAAGAAVLVPTVETRSADPVVIRTAQAGPEAPTAVALQRRAPAPGAATTRDAAVETSDPSGPPSRPSPSSLELPPAPTVVAFFGDSVADWMLRDAAPTFARPDLTLVDAAVEGCDAAANIPEGRGRSGEPLPLSADCRAWPDAYPVVLENAELPVDVAVLLGGHAPIFDRYVGGRWVSPCDEMDWYESDLEARISYMREHAGSVVLVLPAWGGKGASFIAGQEHLARMGCIRARLIPFAARLGLATVDLAELLCPLGPVGECSELRERDGTHVDPEDAHAALEWILERVPLG